jgi:hypothetical protein
MVIKMREEDATNDVRASFFSTQDHASGGCIFFVFKKRCTSILFLAMMMSFLRIS